MIDQQCLLEAQETTAPPSLDSKKEAFLHLENGLIIQGAFAYPHDHECTGEVVFNTGMTGYDASLTDPSYAGQILVFTYPLIGNYGVPPKDSWESEKIHAAAVIVSEACSQWSHGKSNSSLLEWLKTQNIPLIEDIDTRRLTQILRESGTQLGTISPSSVLKQKPYTQPASVILNRLAATKKTIYGTSSKKIIAVDCGMKENIIRNFQKHAVTVERVPYNYNYTDEDFDAIFLSNGAGDPEMYKETIEILKIAMSQKKPIFGICLGAQLLALAAGAKTYKLKYGHRGHNQPCIDLQTDRCYLTSQNHGYAIQEESLPKEWIVSYRNLNDDTVEGIRHTSLPFSAVQFHPEAAPGPTDTEWMFTQFVDSL